PDGPPAERAAGRGAGRAARGDVAASRPRRGGARRAGGGRRGSRCAVSPLAKGAFWLLDYGFAVRGQVQGFFDRTDPETLQSGDREPVLLIPGIWETWRFLLAVGKHLNDAGHPVH